MILLSSLEKNEILNAAAKFPKADPSIVELVIYVFYLLERIKLQEFDFVFKGGTCLMLHFNPPLRFSSDIDIITNKNKDEIEGMLSVVINNSLFTKWELDEKRSYQPGIPKAHYKLFFHSKLIEKEREIMLDILVEKSMYSSLESKEIKLPFINSDEESILVDVPTCNSMLGDKLTAFAPGTTGIGFQKNKGRDIIKQVFDIGKLAERTEDIEEVAHTFSAIADKEIEYRNLNIGKIDIAKDVFNTSYIIARIFRNKIRKEETEIAAELKSALTAFVPFLASNRTYAIDSLLLDASIAAYLTALIACEKTEEFQMYSIETVDLKDYIFSDHNHSFLNPLARLPNGTLYYLKSAYDMLFIE
ncbi:MAG TPA: hypothetical protein ENN61_03275 [Bacteroidaceae bacterium]|nr:hypothetical protein [Bacteroidaceae bacterium]